MSYRAVMTEYKPQHLDKKWQRDWTDARAFEVREDDARPKYYCLEMFAYPSGHAHVGHVRNYIIVEVGCWRCGTMMTTRELEQWFFRITAYADELLRGFDSLTNLPEKVVVMQRNWIGRSEGARVRFPLAGDERNGIEIFTTRIDTIYGATFVLLAPE